MHKSGCRATSAASIQGDGMEEPIALFSHVDDLT
jgi:hypothetical protein